MEVNTPRIICTRTGNDCVEAFLFKYDNVITLGQRMVRPLVFFAYVNGEACAWYGANLIKGWSLTGQGRNYVAVCNQLANRYAKMANEIFRTAMNTRLDRIAS